MKALSYMLYLFFLAGMSSCCFGPWYYQKSGQMYVKGFVPWFGKYEQTLDGADPSTFRKVDNFHVVDSNHVYVLSPSWNMRHIDILKDADPATFEVLSRHGYTRDAHHVWFDTKHETKLVLDADCKTIEVLDDRYARTDSLLFYKGDIVPGVDPKTVVIHKSYIEDKNDVYWRNLPLHVSDRESFTFVKKKHDITYWAKDKIYVYYLWAYDNDNSIVRSTIADYDSFEVINSDYARDKVQVYYHETTIPGADPASFEILIYRYSKDKNHVYLNGKIVEGADPKTFKVEDRGNSKEKYREYNLRE